MYIQSSEITCDLCGEGHLMQETATANRKILKESGWINQGKFDYCHNCRIQHPLLVKDRKSIFSTQK